MNFTQTLADDYALMADNVQNHPKTIQFHLRLEFVSLEDDDVVEEHPAIEFYEKILVPDARNWRAESQRLRGGRDHGQS